MNFICYREGGRGVGWEVGGGGGSENVVFLLLFFIEGGGGYKYFVYIWGGGGRGYDKIGLVSGVISMQVWVLSYVQCTEYRMGIVWGLLKFNFIYLFISKLKMRQV